MSLFLSMPGNESLTTRLAELTHGEVGLLEVHTFPDGESGLRFLNDVTGRDIALVCSLASPNGKFLPLALFVLHAARSAVSIR
jgi:ribose-phosphate pyrophosphokinase